MIDTDRERRRLRRAVVVLVVVQVAVLIVLSVVAAQLSRAVGPLERIGTMFSRR